ncbi:MAG: hypothetical protein CMP66_01160 [Flavobacteriales bacterium]|nr:hypothetical protein [Flavobacteriales bacterium]
MNNLIKHILFYIILLVGFNLKAQSIVKFISGDLEEITVENKKNKITGINQEIDNSSTLFFNDWIIVDINGSSHQLSVKEYPEGVIINNLKISDEKKSQSGYWTTLLNVIFGDDYGKDIEEGLYKTAFQGITRSLFEEIKEEKVCSDYNSKIEWHGNALTLFNEKDSTITIKELGSNSILEKDLTKKCSPCSVKVDNKLSGLILNQELDPINKSLIDSLLLNIENDVNVEFSQFCVFQIFISNDLYLNANYFRDLYSKNKLIEDYLDELTWL